MPSSHKRLAAMWLVCVVAALACAGSAAAASPLAWSSPHSIDGTNYLTAVSCPTTDLCVAVDSSGNIVTSTTPTVTGSWKVQPNVDTTRLDQVSCPSKDLCVADDFNGNVVTSSTPTVSGSWKTQAVDGSTSLEGLSCPSTGLCVAGGFHGNVATSTTPTVKGSWTLQPMVDSLASLNAISCPSSGLCVAADNSGNALRSTTPTVNNSWKTQHIDGFNSFPYGGVSCPKQTSLCVALDHAGNLFTSTTQATSGTWTTPKLVDSAANPSGVSCPSAGLCVAVDNGGNALITTTPTVSGSWTLQPIDSRQVNWVSCPTTGLCVAVDFAGNALVATSNSGAHNPPHTSITKTKINAKKHKAKFSFTATGSAANGFKCALTKRAKKHHKQAKPSFSACSSPKTYKHLKPGRYTFTVEGFNAAGTDPNPAAKTFKIK